jgi:pimeloyl-ACP methyl ester carboxylesterase
LNEPLQAPPPARAWREGRALLDATRMAWPLLRPAGSARTQVRRHVLVLPGFGADDRATWPLRHYLRKLGHHAEGWGQGLNQAGTNIRHTLGDLSPGWAIDPPTGKYRGEGGVPMLCDRMVAHTRERYRVLGEPLTLIGWSLGGVVAREVARELPGLVEAVITLGTPVQGGPKYTAAAPFFRKRGMDLDWIEREVAKRDARPITVPITAIVSRSDAVVGFAAAHDHRSPNVRHVEMDVAHLGLCFNPGVWREIASVLDRAP